MESVDHERIENAFISRHWSFVLLRPERDETLLAALAARLLHIPVDSWEARLAWGGVYVNGRPALEDGPLPSPCRLEYYEPKFPLDEAESFFPAFDERRIAYEDDLLLAYVKPPGLPCLPAREQTHFNLRSYLERYAGRPIHMPSRLDLSTEGIVIASKAPPMHRLLQRLFETRSISKWYLLEAAGLPRWKDLTLETRIGKHPDHPVLRRVSAEGKAALSHFEVVQRTNEGSIWLARPVTGRTHQLRVHASFLRHPIVGDNFYGGPRGEGLRLLAYRLRFRHPIARTEVELTVPREFLPEWAREAVG